MAIHTFGGVRFHTEQQELTSVPLWPSETVLAIEHVPGGDTDVIQNLGKRGAQTVPLAIVVTAANWGAFVALHGQAATLALIGNPTRLATLTQLSNVRWFEATGIYKLQATWVG